MTTLEDLWMAVRCRTIIKLLPEFQIDIVSYKIYVNK